MTIWILHLTLTPEQEETITQRTHLPLPFGDLPDLTQVGTLAECRRLLQLLHPDDPPETMARRIDHFWGRYTNLHEEDIIAVPLQHRKQVAIAEINGRYTYQVGEGGSDMHLIPVKWHERRIPFVRFMRQRALLAPRGEALVEVDNAEARIIIRDRLPHKYNRFARWKWLMLFFFLVNGWRFLYALVTR